MLQIRKRKLFIFISILIVSSTIIGISLGYFLIFNNYNNRYSYRVYYGFIYCEYNVNSCQESGSENINIFILSNSIIFVQTLECYCGPPITDPEYFKIELSLVGNNLTIREIFLPKNESVTRSVCLFRINGKISNISKGEYNLVYIFENSYVDQVYILRVFEIDI
jgi:hypothetical protein